MDHARMRDWIKWSGLTQAEVARAMEVDKQTVSRWVTGKSKIGTKVENRFINLVCDQKGVQYIKNARKPYVRGRPFKKSKNNS
jgi:transcriptional regulator with XRE-family HTH domain